MACAGFPAPIGEASFMTPAYIRSIEGMPRGSGGNIGAESDENRPKLDSDDAAEMPATTDRWRVYISRSRAIRRPPRRRKIMLGRPSIFRAQVDTMIPCGASQNAMRYMPFLASHLAIEPEGRYPSDNGQRGASRAVKSLETIPAYGEVRYAICCPTQSSFGRGK
jgi:hypothetical protein